MGHRQVEKLVVGCRFEGQPGFFAPIAFLNSTNSIPAGREIYGTPKVYADFEIGFAERVMYTNTIVGGTTLMSLRSTMHREATEDEMPSGDPVWRLKVIPRVDGNGLDVMQLIDLTRTTTDQVVHVRRAGDGVVQFNPSPIYDLSDFTPLEYLGAYYVEMDMTENWGEIVKDFLAD